MNSLEKRLVELCRMPSFDLATAGFLASELKSEDKLAEYEGKFDALYRIIKSGTGLEDVSCRKEKSRLIFDWLWTSTPKRYINFPIEPAKLTYTLDNQLARKEEVADCVGLTLLYNSLCQRAGVEMKSVWTIGHIYSALEDDGLVIIENTLPNGFDLGLGIGKVINSQELVQRALIRMAYDYSELEDYERAFTLYEVTLRINPSDMSHYSLRDMAKKLEAKERVISVFGDIVAGNPDSWDTKIHLAYCYQEGGEKEDLLKSIRYNEEALEILGTEDTFGSATNARFNIVSNYIQLSLFEEAGNNLEKFMEITPENSELHRLKGDLLRKLKDYPAAVKAYEKSLELNPENKWTEWRLLDISFEIEDFTPQG